jgi:hypothetical protein
MKRMSLLLVNLKKIARPSWTQFLFIPYFFMASLLFLSSCFVKPRIDITINRPLKTNKLEITLSNVQVINHQIILTGTHLDAVSSFALNESGNKTPLQIESATQTTLVANTLDHVTFAAGKIFDLLLSNANAASTFTINFSLCDSTLGGKGFNCLITPNDKDVLSFDANTNKWVPRNVNGLAYKGTFDASATIVPGGSPVAGDYYIITVAGTINTVSYAIGDWIVYNADELDWQKISNATDVLSVFGRTGKVSAKKGDYTLTKMADVDLTTTPPVANQILKYNGTNWIPGPLTYTETDPLVSAFAKATLPTCAAGQVLKGDGTSLTCVADNAGAGAFTGAINRAVITDGTTGALATSAVTTTELGYLTGVTSALQTQLNAKFSSAGEAITSGTFAFSGTSALTVLNPVNVLDVANKQYVDGFGQWTKSGADIYRAAGNVGIGTTTPTESLDVAGNLLMDGSGAYLIFKASAGAPNDAADIIFRKNNGTELGRIYTEYSGSSGLYLSGHSSSSPDLFINSSGNVGIGTTAPADLIHVKSSTGEKGLTIESTGTGFDGANLTVKNNSGKTFNLEMTGPGAGFGTYANTALLGTHSADLAFLTNADLASGGTNTIRFSTGGSQVANTRMFIDSTGNVGIGTALPTNILSLDGTAARTIGVERNTAAATAGLGLTIASGGAMAGTANLLGGDLTLKSGISTGLGTSNIRFYTATAGSTGTVDNVPTEKMTILDSGNVGIGNTNPWNSKLYVNGNTYTNRIGVNMYPTFMVDVDTNGSGAYTSSSVSYSYPMFNNSSGIRSYNSAPGDGNFTMHHFAVKNTANTTQRAYVGTISNTAGDTPTIVIGQQTGPAAFNERMRIDGSGNVGIGTTGPLNLLDIGTGGGIHITSGIPTSTTAALYNNAGTLYFNGSAVGAQSLANFSFSTNTMTTATGSPLIIVPGSPSTVTSNGNLTTILGGPGGSTSGDGGDIAITGGAPTTLGNGEE